MYRYTLQPYSGPHSRYKCPLCQHRNKTFTRYIDTETGEQVHDDVGRCDRELNCGYHFKPKDYFMKNGINTGFPKGYRPKPVRKIKDFLPNLPRLSDDELSSLQPKWLVETVHTDDMDNFTAWLYKAFGYDESLRLRRMYNIGTSDHWNGATIFWQVDHRGLIRTGKVMLYDVDTAKRVKEPFNHITWMHSLLQKQRDIMMPDTGDLFRVHRMSDIHKLAVLPPLGFKLNQCLFGEHLLPQFPELSVALVESEKTSVIASHYCPDFIWLATGGLNNLTPQKLAVLKSRKVMLFPDINAFDLWELKAKAIKKQFPTMQISTSSYLEKKAGAFDKVNGLDIADVLEDTAKGHTIKPSGGSNSAEPPF